MFNSLQAIIEFKITNNIPELEWNDDLSYLHILQDFPGAGILMNVPSIAPTIGMILFIVSEVEYTE